MTFALAVSPFTAPNYDVFSPARHQDPEGVVIGSPLDGGQSYTPWIGVTTATEIAVKRGTAVRTSDYEALKARADEAEARAAAAEAKVAEFEAAYERIAGFARDGFRVQKMQGRPKKEAS